MHDSMRINAQKSSAFLLNGSSAGVCNSAPMSDPAIGYLRRVIEATGLRPNALAKKAGVVASTLNRPLNDPNWKGKLSRTTIQKIETATGIIAHETRRLPADVSDGGVRDERANLIEIRGEVASNTFHMEATIEGRDNLGASFPDLPMPQFAYRAGCESMNKLALPGHYWICHDYTDPEDDPEPGHFVVVKRFHGDAFELTVRRLQYDRHGNPEFWPNSYFDEWQEPFRPAETGERYEIIARARRVVSDRF